MKTGYFFDYEKCEFIKDSEKNSGIPNFEIGKILSHGMIGVVYLVRTLDRGIPFCLKVMFHTKIGEKKL
jgi:hypothetical protein